MGDIGRDIKAMMWTLFLGGLLCGGLAGGVVVWLARRWGVL